MLKYREMLLMPSGFYSEVYDGTPFLVRGSTRDS